MADVVTTAIDAIVNDQAALRPTVARAEQRAMRGTFRLVTNLAATGEVLAR